MGSCKGIRDGGNACRANAMRGSEFCFWHDPHRRPELISASRRGGARKSVELPEADLLTPLRARRILAGAVAAVAAQSLGPGTGRAIGYLLQVEARIRESHELEDRVTALERTAEQKGVTSTR
jgi:hypothetical protein